MMRGARGHRRTLWGHNRWLHASANENKGAEGKLGPRGPLSGVLREGRPRDPGIRKGYSLLVSKHADESPEQSP